MADVSVGRIAWLCLAAAVLPAGCSNDEGASTEPEPTTCAEAAAVTAIDAVDLAREVVDASQVWDTDALCSLIGRVDIPNGLIRYRQAIADGLSTDVDLVDQRSGGDGTTSEYLFDIPKRGGDTRLGLAFQRQSDGWVLLTAPFIEP